MKVAHRDTNGDTADMLGSDLHIDSQFLRDARAVVYPGDCLGLLATIPDPTVQ